VNWGPGKLTPMSEPLGELALWTPGERDVLAVVARTRGWEWARRYAPRILAQARTVDGDLDPPDLPVPTRN